MTARGTSKSAKRRYGSHPDIPHRADGHWKVPHAIVSRLPATVDLREHLPAVYDQGSLNSCSAHALAAAFWCAEKLEGVRRPMPGSRLFLYYNERAREGKVGENVPVSLRDGYESVAQVGLCSEDLWPYRTDRGLFKKKPPARCYRLAASHEARVHHRLRREIGQLRGCLAEGFPFAFGMSCYESIEGHAVKRSGHLELPAPHEKLLGGHAVLAVGYSKKERRFLVRNSWGMGWGMKGYFTIPDAYLLDPALAWDFWTLRRVEVPAGRRPREGGSDQRSR